MSGDNTLTQEQVREGIAPGAQEWTLTRQHGSWYREQGEWAALVYPGEGPSGLQWNLWLWRIAQGLDGPGSLKYETSVACFTVGCRDNGSLEIAKGTADRVLALRQVPPPAPGLTAREALAYAAVVLRNLAQARDNAADPETRSLRYAAGQLEHFLPETEGPDA